MAEWRRLYKGEWKHGAERVRHVKERIESWGCGLVVEFGFMADSTQYVLAGMPKGHEKGEPDLYVLHKKKHIANIEVTGSWKDIRGYSLFLRPDKVKWAKKHPIPKTWAWFVYNDKEFVIACIDAGQYPIVEKNFRGRIEHYHEIPQADTFSPEMLREFLCRQRK